MKKQENIAVFCEIFYTFSVGKRKEAPMKRKPIPAYMHTLAERVHLLRRRQRWSQAALAEQTAMSPTTLSNIEQAKAPTITVEHLVALARFLGTTPDYLLGMEPPTRRARRTGGEKIEQSELFPAAVA
jgi:DNA-binding Xre family transcriptional regulator